MKNKLLTALILLCALPVHALQIHTATEDTQIKAKISAVETSRITLVGDRIKQFFINQGRIVVEKDETKGDLYITPTEFFHDKDVNLFITSESGKTFSLLLTPTDMPSATISINSSGQNNVIAKAWETKMDYEESLIQLIKAMAQGVPPKGCQVNSILTQKFKNKRAQYKVESVTQYSGSQLSGFILTIKNTHKEKLSLNTTEFSSFNPLATAIEQPVLYPNMQTKIYLVKSNG